MSTKNGSENGSNSGTSTPFKNQRSFLKIGVLVLSISATAAMIAAAVVSPRLPKQDRPVAKALPPAGTYKIDPVHSFAYFGARHHVVGLVRGRFDKVTGNITVAEEPTACSVDVTIDVSSINTQNSTRDADLLSPFYFDAAKFPAMTYHGRSIRRVSATSWTMDGSLTMHGVTKSVPLTFNYNGRFADGQPSEPARMAFHGTAGVKRAEFGMGARDNLDELGMLTSPDVAIEIDVEADANTTSK